MPRADDEWGDGGRLPAPDEELLDTGPRRQLGRWVAVASAAVVALVIVVVIVRQPSHEDNASPAPQSSAPTSYQPQPLPTAVPNIATPVGGEPYDVLADNSGGRLYAFADEHLYALGVDGAVLARSAAVDTGGAEGSDELVFDAEHDIVWVVAQSPSGAAVPQYAQGFDGRTLHQVGRYRLTGQVSAAAVLDGVLYVLGNGMLQRLDTGDGDFETMIDTGADADALVADPARHRLLFTAFVPDRLRIRSWSPIGAVSGPVVLPVGMGQVETVGSTIWLGGGRGRVPVLARLDPRTLRAGRNLAHDAGLRTDLVLDDPGVHSLFAQDGSGGRISCLDGTTGRPLHRFGTIAGIFTSVRGHGFDASPAALHALPMGRCRG